MKNIKFFSFLVILGVICCNVFAGMTYTYSFNAIQDDNYEPINAGIGMSQLFFDVSSYGSQPGKVEFLFYNSGPNDMSITGIYFDDRIDLLSGPVDVDDSLSGVNFSDGATPGNVPGGQNIPPMPFSVTDGFSWGSDSQPGGKEANGVNRDEWLGLTFNLGGDSEFGDVIEALDSGEYLRVAMHVQSFPNENSMSFYNNGRTIVPAPGAAILVFMGVSGLSLIRKRLS